MNLTHPGRCPYLFCALISAVALNAQTSPAPTSDGEAVRLSEFVVNSETDVGYRATNTTAGSRTNEQLRYVPLNIQVVNTEFMQDIGATDLYEAVAYVSGVASETNLLNNNGANIRGFTSLFQLRNFVRWTAISNSFNIERVEVLKGPAAVLYTQAFPGGTLNLITKTPQRKDRDMVSVRVGSFESVRTTVDVNRGSGPVRFRINALWQDANAENVFQSLTMRGVAPSLSFKLGRQTTVVVDGEYSDTERNFQGGASTWFAAVPTRGVGIGDLYRAASLKARYMGPDSTIRRLVVTGTARLEHTFSEALSAQVSYNYQFNRTRVFRPFVGATALIRTDAGGDFIQHQWQLNRPSNSTAVIQSGVVYKFSALGAQHKLLTGFDLSADHGKTEQKADVIPGTVTRRSRKIYIERPDTDLSYVAAGGALVPLANAQDNNVADAAGYFFTLQSAYWRDRLRTMLGYRFDTFSNEVISGAGTFDLVRPSNNRNEGEKFSPMAGMLFTPTAAVTYYALYSEGFTPNGNRKDAYFRFLPAQSAKGYELGAKTSLWQGRLSGSVSAFETTVFNRTELDPSPPPDATNNGNAFIASGEDRARGAEVDLNFTPIPKLDMTLSYSYIDTGVVNSVSAVRKGQRTNNHAFNHANAFARYTLPRGRLAGLFLGGGVRYRSPEVRRYVGARIDENDGYFLVNALAGYSAKVGKQNLRVALNVNNVLDDTYLTGGPNPALGEPRTFALTLTWTR